jgi:hypothetical protein
MDEYYMYVIAILDADGKPSYWIGFTSFSKNPANAVRFPSEARALATIPIIMAQRGFDETLTIIEFPR